MYVSLGASCAVSNYLKTFTKQQTLPFDWTRINITQLNLVLSSNFKEYSDIRVIKYSKNHESYVLKNNYNIQFAHEILNKYELNEFKIKLEKRIIKFYEILNNSVDELNFIRFEFSPYKKGYFNEFIKLLNIIHENKNENCNVNIKLILHKSYEDKLNFYDNEVKIKLNKFRIETYFYNDFSSDWKYPNINWHGILK
jgi:hypothetical protein|tara:strand:+ start:889 stop:1479 length:591 start_codon:yes stop_codon:yes gene_type:complete